MEYKLLVLDIDGTLRAPGCDRVSRPVADAVNAVQASGVGVVLATGRARGGIPARMLRGIRPDYYICANGAQVENAAGESVVSHTMSQEEMYALVDWCEDYEYPLAFAYHDGYYAYVECEQMRNYYRAVTGGEHGVLDGEDQDRHLRGMPFNAFCEMPPAGVAGFCEKYGYLGLKFLPYDTAHYDILSAQTDKAVGLASLLETLGLNAADVVAVGDGSNDVDMLQFAGRGVAMGNGCAEAKAAADVLCPPAQEDGLAAVCRELFPQAFVTSAPTHG